MVNNSDVFDVKIFLPLPWKENKWEGRSSVRSILFMLGEVVLKITYIL